MLSRVSPGSGDGKAEKDEDTGVDDTEADEPAEVTGVFLTCGDADADAPSTFGCVLTSRPDGGASIDGVDYRSIRIQHVNSPIDLAVAFGTAAKNSAWQVTFKGPFGSSLAQLRVAVSAVLSGKTVQTVFAGANVGTQTSQSGTVDGDPPNGVYGSNESALPASCREAQSRGMTTSGNAWILPTTPSGDPTVFPAWCDQELLGGGWTMVVNAVAQPPGQPDQFFDISFAERLDPLGEPALDRLYHHGGLYGILTSPTEPVGSESEVLDVAEDFAGHSEIIVRATTLGFDPETMRFVGPAFVTGSSEVFAAHIAAGWSTPDLDGDTDDKLNCASAFGNVSQHYGDCLAYSFGSDALGFGEPATDGLTAPHLRSTIAADVGLIPDSSAYSEVKRITRYVRAP